MMGKCSNCGEEKRERVNLCPKCGLAPGPEALTNIPPTPMRRQRKQERIPEPGGSVAEREREHEEGEGAVCGNCGEDVPERVNLCPTCGLAPGPVAMTEIQFPKLRRKKK